ncbi:hypothetical protein CWE17_01795 [Synechococcus sp. BS56D]|uniref:hypothetical protein n=1 Tax=Synechococcus sp. BS56D TaxID=2055944 RepID=UPI00103866AD|nr:hypothetical protein [Synechococcus sp. BS56D]TCD59521.1 hypothetical protein CWE17_01795 [Synechococcus sp. BS56D]
MALRRLGWLLLPLVLLQACSSTPFGRQLADSFDSPAAAPASAPAANGAGRPKPPSSPKTGAAAKTGQEDPAPTSAPIAEKPAAPLQSQPKPVPQSAAPQPYRIILRLSSADPAAPAEQVTRSLREAGIAFEVETIERIQPPERLSVTPERKGATP